MMSVFNILDANALAVANLTPCRLDSPQKRLVVLQPVVKPVLFRLEADRHPAGLPCRVITISSVSACRMYLESSSLIWLRGIFFIGLAFLLEPSVGIGLCNDREDLDFPFSDVVKDPQFTDSEAVLWAGKPAKSFDSSLAYLGRLVSQVNFQSVPNCGAITRDQAAKIINGFGGKSISNAILAT